MTGCHPLTATELFNLAAAVTGPDAIKAMGIAILLEDEPLAGDEP